MNKTNFLRGRQCPLRSWLDARPEITERAEAELEDSAIFEPLLREARLVEDLAKSLFGKMPYRREIEFRAGVLKARIDYLEEFPSGYWIWEVKASSRVKPVHHWDLAFQCFVAEQAGLVVLGAGVIHLNVDVVRGEQALAAENVLVMRDCTEEVRVLQEAVKDEVDAQLATLDCEDPPDFAPQGQCKANRNSKDGNRPDSCPHLNQSSYCGEKLPKDWAGFLPRIGSKLNELSGLGKPTMELAGKLIPSLNASQLRFIEAFRICDWVVDRSAMSRGLESFHKFPRCFLDFEFVPACGIPPFAGMKPNQKLPFQWSLGIQNEPNGELHMHNFVHPDPTSDPRRDLIQALMEVLPSDGPVVVHFRGAESSVLNLYEHWLGGEYWEFAESVVRRLEDTCELAQQTIAHPDLQGSFSLKKLAPALVGKGYEDLKIQNGMLAVTEWQKLEQLRGAAYDAQLESLIAYCQRDAELMLGLLQAYEKLGSEHMA